MRDLFQVVFELKKKEIEMARQQIQSKTIHEHQTLSLNIKSNIASNDISNLTSTNKSINESSKSNAKEVKYIIVDIRKKKNYFGFEYFLN